MNASVPNDSHLLRVLGSRLRNVRLARNLTQEHVADEAGIGEATLRRLEDGQGASTLNLIRVLRALDLVDRFADLVPEERRGPMAQLLAQERKRQRASGRRGR